MVDHGEDSVAVAALAEAAEVLVASAAEWAAEAAPEEVGREFGARRPRTEDRRPKNKELRTKNACPSVMK